MMSSEEDTDCFGLFTDDKSLLKTNLALTSTNANTTEIITKLEIPSTSPLLNFDDLVTGDKRQPPEFDIPLQQQLPIPLQNGLTSDLLYKEEQVEEEVAEEVQQEKLITNDSRGDNTQTNTCLNSTTHTTTATTKLNNHDENFKHENNDDDDIIVNVNTTTSNCNINDEGDDEVIFLFGQQQTSTNKTRNTTSNSTSTTTTTTTTTTNNSDTTLQHSTAPSQQHVVTDVDDNLESSHKGAVNKTTSSKTSCGLKNIKSSVNTLNKKQESNKKSTKNNTVTSSLRSLKIKFTKSNLPSNKESVDNNNKQVLDNNNKLINNSHSLLTTSDFCLTNLEDFSNSKSDLSVFSSLPYFITQLQNSTTNQSRTSPQLLAPSTVGLTPSTAAALMSTAAAAAAGAAGQALYGALLSSQQPTSSTSPLTKNFQLNQSNNNNNNSLHSPNSQSTSPTSALLTGQFSAALANLFGANGFGSAKMLNELFGRQMKQAQDATSGLPSSLDNAMLAAEMESATNAELLSSANLGNSLQLTNTNKLLNNNNNNTITNHSQEHQLLLHTPSPENRRTSHSSERSSEDNSGRQSRQGGDLQNSTPRAPSVGNTSTNGVVSTTFNSGLQQQQSDGSPTLQQQQNDLDHHMLRNILQHKKELMQSLANNNNNNNNSSECKDNSSSVINLIEDSMSEIKIKSEPLTHQQTSMELMNGSRPQERRKSSDSLQSHEDQDEQRSEQDHLEQQENDPQDNEHLDMPAQVTKKEAEDILEDVELMGLNSRSDLESLTSPSHSDTLFLDNSKDDLEEEINKDLSAGISKKSDLKRARVENIVSSMRSSPSSQQQHSQVIGCKKRKANPPQQCDVERYVAAAVDDGDSDENELHQKRTDKIELEQKRNEIITLAAQSRFLQELLAEKQQEFEKKLQQSECQEIEDNNSDSMEQDENNGDLSPSPSLNGDAAIQEKQHQQDCERVSSTSPSLLQMKNGKHLSATNSSMNLDANPNNVLSQVMSKMITLRHPHIQQPFNGPLSLLQHMPQLQTGEGGITQTAISNAAAMYLGPQFFLEQEARMAAQQQLQQQQAQAQEQQEQQRRFEQEQQQLRRKEEQQQHQAQQQLQRRQQLQQLQQEQQQTLQQSSTPQLHHIRLHRRHNNTALKPEFSEKSNMLRSSSNSTVEISDADLESLAGEMKSKIYTSLSALVDTVITQFIHQKRILSKQSDTVAASAKQLNKDLLLASQYLDRKSPRTKVADRSQMNSTSSSQSAQSSAAAGVSTVQQAGNNGTLLLNNNLATNSLNHNQNTNSNPNHQQQLGHLQHSQVSNNGPPSLLGQGPVTNVTVNVPQHVQLQNPNCQNLVPTPSNGVGVVTPNMAQIAQAQNCQNLIAAPRLNGSQLSFPSPAAAAAAAMGLQMHHAAAAAAMSAAAQAASGQQQQQQQQLQTALNQHHHVNNLNDVAQNANVVNSLTNLNNSQNSSNLNTNNSNNNNNTNNNSLSSINIPPPHIRPSPTAAAMFQAPKTPQGMNPVAAAALYNSMTGGQVGGPMQNNPFCMPEPRDQQQQQQQQQQQPLQQQQQQQQQLEQNEALSLVVTPKKKRHKVTDTRITPRTVSRILAQDGMVPPSSVGATPNGQQLQSNQNNGPCNNNLSNALNPASLNNSNNNNCNNPLNSGNQQQQQQQQQQQNNITSTTPAQSPSPRGQVPAGYHPNAPPPPPPPMMPVSLPTIPNPPLHESQVYSPYSPFFNPHPPHAPPPPPHGPHSGPHAPPTAAQMHHMKLSTSPPGGLGSLMDSRDGSPPLPPHPSTMLHPVLLAAAHHSGSPDYSAHLRAAMDAQDRSSDCNSADMQFEGMQSFLQQHMIKNSDSLTTSHSSTLTPMHLRKAKLMFFWVRYPSSSVLKMYFPDIKFNKNNTAQLVKWFSNFREFYYIQMEKYARQAVTESVKCAEDLHISGDSELYRVLNLHYNRNNHIEVPQNFRFVVEQTLREFFRAIQGGKDTEQSWKKSIYKIISRLDDQVPEYFKSPNFLEQLE